MGQNLILAKVHHFSYFWAKSSGHNQEAQMSINKLWDEINKTGTKKAVPRINERISSFAKLRRQTMSSPN